MCSPSGQYNDLKSRANGSSIVGQQLPALLGVTCCVRLHTIFACCCVFFFGFVAKNLKALKNFRYVQKDLTTPNNVASICLRVWKVEVAIEVIVVVVVVVVT